MTDEVWNYFRKRYKESDVRVVPGHWPDFKTKEEVDKWFKIVNSMFDDAFNKCGD
ncbi:MAG: hypothetical protein ABFC57_12750 [Veillonellales bacterium]